MLKCSKYRQLHLSCFWILTESFWVGFSAKCLIATDNVNGYWSWHTHTHTHPACTLSSAVLNVGVLMLCKFLSRLVGKERCQADSCSDFTFPRMWSRIGNSGESLPGTDTHTHTHPHSEKHMYLEAHMHQLTITHTHRGCGGWRAGEARCHRPYNRGMPS